MASSACDPGPATDASKGVGPPVHVISTNLASPLPANSPIEIAFDRLLLPESISRQTFILNITPPPLPSYDPITRIVTLTPLTPLVPGQTYEIGIATPQSATDLNGLRAIDGATIDPKDSVIAFQVTAPVMQSGSSQSDFYCQRVQPIFSGYCGSSSCHGGYLPAEGLGLTTPSFVSSTAIGRVAHESNNGPSAQPQAAGLIFNEDMPIVDPGSGGAGDPGHSWLLYKLLLAEVAPDAPLAGTGTVQWQPLSSSERAILASYVPGREMPYPTAVDAGADSGQLDFAIAPALGPLSTAQMETISLWIAQGAPVPATCP